MATNLVEWRHYQASASSLPSRQFSLPQNFLWWNGKHAPAFSVQFCEHDPIWNSMPVFIKNQSLGLNMKKKRVNININCSLKSVINGFKDEHTKD